MSSNSSRRLGFKQMLADLEANSRRAAELPEPDPSLTPISSYACDDPVVHRESSPMGREQERHKVPA
jgi:hypothetical protein